MRRADTPLLLNELAELCAHVCDTSRASLLYDLLAPYDGQLLVAYGGASCQGAAARALAQLEAVLGRFEEAERHFEAALRLERGFHAYALVPRTSYWYARMLLQRATRTDTQYAYELLDLTLAETQRLGMQTLHNLAETARRAS